MIADRVRLRIAPSPTGYLHIGNVRAALFNWLYARRHGGVFIIRIDDTDQARSDDRYIDDVVEGFRWLDLDWDEGIAVGGPHGTYRQSDRFDRYREAAEQFLDAGRAYYDFRSAGELDELRARARREKKPPGYYIRRPPGSDPEDGRRRTAAGESEGSSVSRRRAMRWSSPTWSGVRCGSSRMPSTTS